ncbi:proton-coupled zinc antiporter SLC30A5-like [Antedon mediterranea]|uniref:proton-coupled zinc antiporter SLC30A5-like n=1 Tax=Antedon mediterranea TaxID=105859 RepID=UPI003AF7F2C3
MAAKFGESTFSGGSHLGRVDPRRLTPFIFLLVATKLLRAFGLFIAYDVLKTIHLTLFVFIIKSGCAGIFLVLQKPFSSGRRITRHQWIRILKHAFGNTLITLLWMFGLTICGPARTILLFEHCDVVIIAAAAALFTSTGGGPARTRGAFLFMVAILSLFLFDVDLKVKEVEHPEGPHSSAITHLFYKAISWLGVSDHKGGVLLLVLLACVNVAFKNASRKLSVDVGGAKRLHALSKLLSSVLMLPWLLYHSIFHEGTSEPYSALILPILVIILFVFVIDYYIDAVSINRLDVFKTARYGTVSIFISALALSWLWNNKAEDIGRTEVNEDHGLTGGYVFSTILFITGTNILATAIPKTKGNLIGYSSGGMPMYTFTGDALKRTSQSLMSVCTHFLKKTLDEPDSRQIFYYLCINLLFTFVEIIYGAWTNSLGLLSDGFHMLFDCTALVLGLSAAIMSKWKSTRIFSYGYGRVEILSGFVNALFLVVVSFFVFTAALGRLLDPPEINTERLMTVSVAGLCVNLIGIFAFRHAHSHGHGHSHGGGHGHSHGGSGRSSPDNSHAHNHGHNHSHNHSGASSGHGHSHGASHHGHSHGSTGSACSSGQTHKNTNMEGVFLHVLADTMGSVGVIISSFLIDQFGLLVADPICSIFIAVLIFLSIMPLLKETSVILLQRTPVELEHKILEGLNKVKMLEGVMSYRNQHFWQQHSAVVAGTLHVQVGSDANEQKIIHQVAAVFKECGVQNFTVQIEKEAFYHHMSGLSASFDSMMKMTKQVEIMKHKNDPNFDIKTI